MGAEESGNFNSKAGNTYQALHKSKCGQILGKNNQIEKYRENRYVKEKIVSMQFKVL